MRFILNFIFFGVLFYAIYLAFPTAFFKMVEWANQIYEFTRNVFLQLSDKFYEMRSGEARSTSERVLALLPLSKFINF